MKEEIHVTIGNAVEAFKFAETAKAINDFLIRPKQKLLTCEYTDESITTWLVAEMPDEYDLAYAPGRGDPWGLVQRNCSYLGPDDHWFATLEDAFMHSHPMQNFRPAGYEVS